MAPLRYSHRILSPAKTMSTFTETFNLKVPLIQAPMAGVQDARLAIAVSQSGALGSLPCATLTPELARQEMLAIQAAGIGAWNVNFFCHVPPPPDAVAEAAWRDALAPYYQDYGIDSHAIPPGAGRAPFDAAWADVIEPFRPPVVSFHFGLPSPDLMARVKAWGAKVCASATTVAEARWLVERGVDAVIAQGLEAGGHRGHFLSDDLTMQSGTFSLVRQLAMTIDRPVIAAGGIADRAGVVAALALGAAAVQVGTRFMCAHEAKTNADHRRLLQDAELSSHTALTRLFTGRPARGIVNRLMRDLGPMASIAPAFPLATAALAPLRAAAEKAGCLDFSPLWAGQNTRYCRAQPAADIVAELVPYR
jgi:nitronate monooxygenase